MNFDRLVKLYEAYPRHDVSFDYKGYHVEMMYVVEDEGKDWFDVKITKNGKEVDTKSLDPKDEAEVKYFIDALVYNQQ